MRLVCPNCDAEYEVDDAAIPKDGRDVQCSNCGHAWFQAHPETEAAEEAEADLYDPPAGAVAETVDANADAGPVTEATAFEPEPEAEPAPEPEPETAPATAPEPKPRPADDADDDEPDVPPPPPAAEGPPAKARSLDETVLAVLREEAERETASRRAEATPAPALESQTEMPLAAAQDAGGMAAAVRRIAKMRGVAAEPDPVAADPDDTPAPKSRGQMFPAIDEINSSLRATGDRGQDQDDAIVDTLPDLTRKRGGFGRGFLLLISLAVVIVALYLLAPMIGTRVPALAGTAEAYVTAVDAARVWLDVNLRSLVKTLRDLAGGQGG